MKKKLALLLGGCGMFATVLLAQGDPPSRVARLNYIQGYVSMQPAGIDDWVPAIVNRPFTTGDYLYTDQNSRAELHFGIGTIRMSQYTTIGILNLDDSAAQIELAEGQFNLHVRRMGPGQTLEVDTPNAAISIVQPGDYRIDVNSANNLSFVVVRNGQVDVTGGGQAFTMQSGDAAQLTGTDTLAIDIEGAPTPDSFDNFCIQRDQHEARLPSARYVSEDMIGYEDLDDNGAWQTDATYGAVWHPRAVVADWAPYRNGHWAWIEPWGWTWVDDAPWGFAPFHYGRWVYTGGGWGWSPGPVVVVGAPRPRPYYAPALVAFVGGSGWGVSVGGGASVGWIALGWGEVYRPSYHVSQGYFQNVNVSNTVINKTVNITNVYNVTYINKTTTNITTVNYINMKAPNAVTAMPQQSFASGQPTARAAVSLKSDQVAHIQANQAVLAPNVAPTRTAVAPTYQVKGATPHPPAQLLTRPVVAKATPPPTPVSFQSKQAFLAKNVGQPFNAHQLHQTVRPVAAAQAIVRQAPPAKHVDIKSLPKGNPQTHTAAAPQNAVNTKAPQAAQPPNQKLTTLTTKPEVKMAAPQNPATAKAPDARPAPPPSQKPATVESKLATATTKPEAKMAAPQNQKTQAVEPKPAPKPAEAPVTKPEPTHPAESTRPTPPPPAEKRPEAAPRTESKTTTTHATTTTKNSTTTTNKQEKKQQTEPQ